MSRSPYIGVLAATVFVTGTLRAQPEPTLVEKLVARSPGSFADPTRSTKSDRKVELVFPQSGHSGGASLDERGLPVLKDCLLVMLAPDASLDDFDELLRKHKLEIHKARPPIPSLNVLTLQVTTETPAFKDALKGNDSPTAADHVTALKAAAAALKKERIIKVATPNIAIGRGGTIPTDRDQSAFSGAPRSIWSFRQDLPAGVLSGTYGLSQSRFPAAWNFNQFIDNRSSRTYPVRVPVWVIDIGYATHDDLEFSVVPGFEASRENVVIDDNAHGLHVAGIIAARHGNGKGIDGACRYCDLRIASLTELTATSNSPFRFQDNLALALALAAEAEVPPKVINLSMGFNWHIANINTARPSDQELEAIKEQMPILQLALDRLEKRKVLVVSAAGNDSARKLIPPRDVSCELGNVINYTAHNAEPRPKNVLIVEAVGRDRALCAFSNSGGEVAAAGDTSHSLVHFDPRTFAMSREAVALKDGTSQAAPLVTGLIAQLYAYNPRLTMEEVRKIVIESSRPNPANGRPVIDAFEAMLRAHPHSLTHLADLDGDGKVTQKDRLVLTQKLAAPPKVAPVWPREDLNGDGKLDPNARQLVWIPRLKALKELTDLEVLNEALANPPPDAPPP